MNFAALTRANEVNWICVQMELDLFLPGLARCVAHPAGVTARIARHARLVLHRMKMF